jgi:Na+/melibiose symporter-like transporter
MISVPKGLAVLGAALVVFTPGVAHAYMGPGLGLGFLGAVFGVIGSILLGIAAIIWYPIKRLWRKLRPPKDHRSPSPEDQTPEV